MSFIYNITSHVGGQRTCPNQADDVMLAQFFMREVVAKIAPDRTVRELPQVNGKMDAITAFWIYHCQNVEGGSMQIDGIMSPAKGLTYGSRAWLISVLNFHYKKYFPDKFDKLADHHEFSPSLRASLKV